MADYDLVVRNGTVATASDVFRADIGIVDGRIATIGTKLAAGRRDIDAEKVKAIAQLRTEAVDLAIAAASKAIEKNLDDAQNRKLVESYLASVK